MKNYLRVSLVFFALITIFSGCATLVGGKKYIGSIIVRNHPHTSISVDKEHIGKGSAIKQFPRKKPLTVSVSQQGCEPKTQVFHNRLRTGSLVLSASIFGYAGLAVDLYTGASFKPDHKRDSAIQKLSRKNYVFIIDYTSCPNTFSESN